MNFEINAKQQMGQRHIKEVMINKLIKINKMIQNNNQQFNENSITNQAYN